MKRLYIRGYDHQATPDAMFLIQISPENEFQTALAS